MAYLSSILIGRESNCEIKLDDTSVSRLHLEAQLLPSGDIYITDCHSRRGTYLDEGGHERRIRQGRVSRHATLRLGDSRLPASTIIDALRRVMPRHGASSTARVRPQPRPQPNPQPSLSSSSSGSHAMIRCAHCSEVKPIGAPCPRCRRHTEYAR